MHESKMQLAPVIIARIAATHIETLAVEISKETECIQEPYAQLVQVGLRALYRIQAVLMTYYVRVERGPLHQGLIESIWDFVSEWERWQDTKPEFKYYHTKLLHAYLLRFAKGALKAYRIWRIDTA